VRGEGGSSGWPPGPRFPAHFAMVSILTFSGYTILGSVSRRSRGFFWRRRRMTNRHSDPDWRGEAGVGAICGKASRRNNLSILAGAFAHWLCCSLVTDPYGYASRSRLASGQNSCAIIAQVISSRRLMDAPPTCPAGLSAGLEL